MQNVNVLEIIPVIFYGVSLIFGVLVLITPLWNVNRTRPDTLRRMTALAMGLNLVDMALWVYAYFCLFGEDYESFTLFGESFDILVVSTAALVGEAVSRPRDFKFKKVLYYIGPFVLMTGIMSMHRFKTLIIIDALMCILYLLYLIPHQLSRVYHAGENLKDAYSDLHHVRRSWYYRIMGVLALQICLYLLPALLNGSMSINPRSMESMILIYVVVAACVWIYVVQCVLQVTNVPDESLYDPFSTVTDGAAMVDNEAGAGDDAADVVAPVRASGVGTAGSAGSDSPSAAHASAAHASAAHASAAHAPAAHAPAALAPAALDSAAAASPSPSPSVVPDSPNAGPSGYDPHHALWINRLEKAIVEDKIYLQPDLTSADLARFVGTNRSYLSDYINKVKHTNFYDYINGFRMEEVARLLPDKSLTMTDIADKCGFSDIRTFRRMFKEVYGCLPSVYKR